jgi:hypothetical protein
MNLNAKFVRTNGLDQDTFIFKGNPRPGVYSFEIETPASRGTFKHQDIRVPYDYILNFLKPLQP